MAAPSITGTLVAGAGVMSGTAATPAPLATAPRAPTIRGTLVPDAGSGQAGAPAGRAATVRYLSHSDFDEEAERLRYLGELIRRERQPLCPLNGQVALVPASSPAQSGPIKIGLLAPLSGAFSATGKDMLVGTEQYLDEIGRTVAGRKIELIVEDTEGTPATALTKARTAMPLRFI